MAIRRRWLKGRRRRSSTSLKIERDSKRNVRKYSKRYLELLNYVKLRDGYKCQMPGCKKPTGVKLTVHHIVRFADSKALRQNKYNLISLCFESHKKVTGKEKRYEAKFKTIVRRNEANYKRDKKTKEEILAAQRAHQILPDGFEEYKYQSDEDITKTKALEYYLRKTWRLMKFRTQNKTSNSYKAYGGRGITMCKEWVDDFDVFEKYVLENLGDRPEGSSIDRENNDGNYEPGNVRWATAEVQGQNRRTTLLDEEMVAVILILYYKYKFKIARIIDVMSLPSRSSANGCIKGKCWKNVCIQYKSIITDQKVLDLLNDYEKKSK